MRDYYGDGSYDPGPDEDPDHDRKCDRCGSKTCEGECVLLEQDSTEYPDTDGAYGGGIARNN